jgi:hypothetical protein
MRLIPSRATAVIPASSLRKPKRLLIIAKGIVGCGKSTFTRNLINSLQDLYSAANSGDGHDQGWTLFCADEGTDKYASRKAFGERPIEIVKRNLQKYRDDAAWCMEMICSSSSSSCSTSSLVSNNQNHEETLKQAQRDFVVIIDTCGESESIFDIDFSEWDHLEIWINFSTLDRISEYLAWSVRNVLCRSGHETLSPTQQGIQTCFDVAMRKGTAHGLEVSSLQSYDTSSLDKALQGLEEKASKYQQEIVEKFDHEGNVKMVWFVLSDGKY